VAECQFIKRKELSKKLDQSQILNSLMINLELEELELEVVITSSELLDSKKETSTGHQKQSLEKLELLMLFTTHQTTNLLEQKLLLRTVLFKSMQLHSPNGTLITMVLT
jgi:hypothetical protein